MSANIHLRGVDKKTFQLLKQEAANQDISVNALILGLIKKGLGLSEERKNILFHDLDPLAGKWSKKDVNDFMKSIKDFEQIDKDLWK